MATVDVRAIFKGKSYALTISESATVAALKARLAQAVGEKNFAHLRLLIQGRNPSDGDRLEKYCRASRRLRVMMLVSKSGRKEEKRRRDEEERKRSWKELERIKDGITDQKHLNANSSLIETEIGGDDVNDNEKFVLIIHGKNKWRIRVVDDWANMNVWDIKCKLEEMAKIDRHEQRLLIRGRDVGDEETLESVGCKGAKCGGRWMLLCKESWHKETARKKEFEKVQREVENIEKDLNALEVRIKHRVDGEIDIGIEVQRLEDTAKRLQDNIGVFTGKDTGASANLARRVEQAAERLANMRKEALESAWSK